jgi:tetratricopeptide (TPR) repeat protein
MSESEEDFHRKMARKCFNEAWDYLEKKNRDDSEERTMLHLTHASRYHWVFVGTPQNVAVSDWQISRIYASLNQPQLALQFAKSCLETCEKNSLSEVLHTAYEAIARAYAVSKDYERAKDYLNRAREQLAKLQLDEEERKIYSDQIHETEQMIRAA